MEIQMTDMILLAVELKFVRMESMEQSATLAGMR